MDCNKDEAIRAKKIAEMKMEDNDFEGARKIALKAQNLYPELESISQLLSVCDVHCSAQKQIYGSEKDWYGILQVERLADEVTIKKQYRRLALFLHPDKNRFPGAEAAFKLICEANAVLTDPTKKNLYDSKIRVAAGSASVKHTPYHLNRNSQFNKQYGSHNNAYTHYSSLHQHQTADPSFWTSCPFCSMKYQYHRKFVNTLLQCPKCSKNFTGYESSAPFPTWVPPGAQQMPAKPMGQNAGFPESGVPSRSKFTTGIHNLKGSSSKFDYQHSANMKPVQTKDGIRGATATTASVNLKSKGTSNNVNSLHGGKRNSDANVRKRGSLNNKSRKRGRKLTAESSESCDSSSDSDVTINENPGSPRNDLSSGPGRVHFPRRSTRRRQNISYHEEEDDDDDDDNLPSRLKSSQGSKLSEDNAEEQITLDSKDAEDGNEDSTPEENVQHKNANSDKEVKKRGERGGTSGTGADPIEIEIESDSDEVSLLNDDPPATTYDCPDPEFNDFEKNRAEGCFSVNQFWACYDSIDGMPRFYAKVKKVRRSPFELSIAWLEADPVDQDCKKWRDAGLPVGCGIFKLGMTEQTSQLPTFSHQIQPNEGKKRGSFVIYPRQGEVWALFKNWDLSWSSEPANHREYKYEFVEVLSEFDVSRGIKVRYLDKVTGFVSLFERSSQSETGTFIIAPNEIYRFSHCIPSCTMKGSERQGVPIGSFELDPASLPLNPDDFYCPGVNNVPPKQTVEKG